jgi:ribonuclease HI
MATEAVGLAFDAAFLGDRQASERMLVRAASALTGGHEPRCRNSSPAGTPSGRRSAVRGQVMRWAGGGTLVAATDASWKRPYDGMGYVTSDGRWALRCRVPDHRDPTGPSKVLVSELRAVELLLADLGTDSRPVTVLVDSASARSFLHRWQAGDVTTMPPGYSLRPRFSGQPPTLARLAQRVAALPHLVVGEVRAHQGHPLNEAADSLAKIARRKAVEKFDARSRAQSLVEAFLNVWHEDRIALAA